MNSLNLIPIHRRRAKARQERVRAWIIVNSVFLAGLIGIGITASMLMGSDHPPGMELAKVTQEVELSGKQMLVVRQQLAEAQQTMAAVKAVSEQPDWSVLLAVVSKSLGDNLVLSQCELTPMKDDVATNDKSVHANRPKGVQLHLSGVGRSQAGVAQFVLRLEATNLFERVDLLHTERQTVMSADAVGFELECPLAGRIGGTP